MPEIMCYSVNCFCFWKISPYIMQITNNIYICVCVYIYIYIFQSSAKNKNANQIPLLFKIMKDITRLIRQIRIIRKTHSQVHKPKIKETSVSQATRRQVGIRRNKKSRENFTYAGTRHLFILSSSLSFSFFPFPSFPLLFLMRNELHTVGVLNL